MGLINNVIMPWASDGESMCMLDMIEGNWGMVRKIIAYPLPLMTDRIKMKHSPVISESYNLETTAWKHHSFNLFYFFKFPHYNGWWEANGAGPSILGQPELGNRNREL